ncbi:MAG: CCA tRNA nucleotidyltransferase [Theionarchaea archaeon]|nr:CCA tRNA nucleotidyltransferase [Theionarchaea archaeon]
MKEVLKKIRPTEDERKAVKKVIEDCTGILKDRIKGKGLDAHVSLQGSMAKDTWISGDKNIDMFLIFSHDYSEKELKTYGLEIGVLGEYEIAYAEHPYVRNFVKGYEVDVVPAYQFREGIRSSVDRTPLHTEYVRNNLKDKDQVRLLKKFTRSIGVYGSDLKVQGLSGYLCELLVIKYETFDQVLKNVSTLRPGACLWLETPPSKEFIEPLIFVDPVDPERNVAAVVSLENLTRLVYHAGEYLKNPGPSYFFREPESYTRISGTELYRIDFQLNVIDDLLFPQLRKTRDYMVMMLEHHGFRVFNTAVFDKGILIELSVFELPPFKKHLGPPVYEKEHCERFLQKHSMAGVHEDRIYAVIDRKHVKARDLLRDLLESRQGFGKDLITAQVSIALVPGSIDVIVY